MNSKRRKGKGAASALVLALVAMLALSALGAGAAQAANKRWHIGGKDLIKELKLESETFKSSGAFEFTIPAYNAHFNCQENGYGKTIHQSGAEWHLTLSGCKMQGFPSCKIEPMEMALIGLLQEGESGLQSEKSIVGELWMFGECPLPGANLQSSINDGLLPTFGSEALELSSTWSGTLGTYLGHPVTWSGSSKWHLSGPNETKTFGRW
jgi:hypothetical protein